MKITKKLPDICFKVIVLRVSLGIIGGPVIKSVPGHLTALLTLAEIWTHVHISMQIIITNKINLLKKEWVLLKAMNLHFETSRSQPARHVTTRNPGVINNILSRS